MRDRTRNTLCSVDPLARRTGLADPRVVLLAALALGTLVPPATAQTSATASPTEVVLAHAPDHPDTSAQYLFYLHGKIVEDQGTEARSPEFGPYEYEAIVAELAARGFTVISEVRPRDTDVDEYAAGLVREIEALLAAGVPPRRVTVVGHSKGGAIALRVSALLANDGVGYVILAGCAEWSFRGMPGPLRGRILSLYDRSDRVAGTCKPLFAGASEASTTREVVFNLGAGHGLFFRPEGAWMAQVEAWALGAAQMTDAPAPK